MNENDAMQAWPMGGGLAKTCHRKNWQNPPAIEKYVCVCVSSHVKSFSQILDVKSCQVMSSHVIVRC